MVLNFGESGWMEINLPLFCIFFVLEVEAGVVAGGKSVSFLSFFFFFDIFLCEGSGLDCWVMVNIFSYSIYIFSWSVFTLGR